MLPSSLLHLAFRLLYHELAWTYDAVSWLVSLGEWRRWQQAALPYVQGERVLELGHGPGHLLRVLHTAVPTLVGLDNSPQMGRLAQRRAPGVPLVRGQAQALPFAPGSFDTVLATFPTEYIVAPQTLTAVARVLAENGRLLIVPTAYLTGHTPLHRFITWLFRITGQQTEVPPAQWEPYLVRLRAAGFAITLQQVPFARSAATLLICEKIK